MRVATSIPDAGLFARTESTALFPAMVGFFFVFRAALVFLFFRQNPVGGTELAVIAGVGLVFCAVLWSATGQSRAGAQSTDIAVVRWIGVLLALSLASACWTGASSLAAALGYWTAMAADVALAVFLLRQGDVLQTTESIMMGAVWGGTALALIGWCIPVTEDMRLGDLEFLHPNTLGLEIGMAALMAQYLARRGVMWRWLAFGLAITLLRTLSKTAIIAFLLAETWYLLQSRQWSRAAKVRMGAAAALVVACFWGLLSTYTDVYASTGRGDQLETLTGRTVLWAVTASIGMERSWLGHGLYSFKSLVPAFGSFAPVHAHNELLQQFFEYGLAGVAVVIAIYGSFLRQARRVEVGELRTLAIALWIFAVVRGLADAVVVELTYPLWLMIAMAVCLRECGSRKEIAR